MDNADAFSDQVRRGETMTIEDRTNYRRAVLEVVGQCTDIVYDLFCDAGTGVVMEGSVLQRALRDMLTLRSHFMIMPDIAAENAGCIQLARTAVCCGINEIGAFSTRPQNRVGKRPMKPLIDNASVSIDFPDKVYMGSFSRESGFDVHAGADEVLLKLVRPGEERREVSIHLHYYLLADILRATAEALADGPSLDESHTESLQEAAAALNAAVGGRKSKRKAKTTKR